MTTPKLSFWKPSSGVAMFFFGSVVTGVAVYFLSGDWVCAAIGAAMLGAMTVPLLDKLIGLAVRVFNRRRDKPIAWGRRQRQALVIVFALGVTMFTRVALHMDEPRMFAAAFGIPPPVGVTHLTFDRYYAGGPGDMICLVRFNASRATVDQLVAASKLTLDNDTINLYSTGAYHWENVWNPIGRMAGWHNSDWKMIAPIEHPLLYHDHRGQFEQPSVDFIWDPATTNGYVMISWGLFGCDGLLTTRAADAGSTGRSAFLVNSGQILRSTIEAV